MTPLKDEEANSGTSRTLISCLCPYLSNVLFPWNFRIYIFVSPPSVSHILSSQPYCCNFYTNGSWRSQSMKLPVMTVYVSILNFVGWTTRLWVQQRGSWGFSCKSEHTFLSLQGPYRLWDHTTSDKTGTGDSFSGGKSTRAWRWQLTSAVKAIMFRTIIWSFTRLYGLLFYYLEGLHTHSMQQSPS